VILSARRSAEAAGTREIVGMRRTVIMGYGLCKMKTVAAREVLLNHFHAYRISHANA